MKENKFQILNKFWGYKSFRPLQEEIIDQVLLRNDILALLPTGGGKSLCFQIPALMMDGVCVVISPLIALMQDQVDSLKKRGINAEFLNSTLSHKNIDRILDNCIYGNIKLLYISPERIESRIFKDRFKKMDISFIAVDEAHCISQWGNDFRPKYKNIAILKQINKDVKFIALTATATKLVSKDIQKQLKFNIGNIIQKSFLRTNINYKVISCINKTFVLKKIILDECTIIYVRSRKQAKDISDFLNENNYKSDFYHAGLTNEERIKKQTSWIKNEYKIIVATNAFGMGIDKPDVKTVIHYELPESIESFYQESGRAGRNGKSAYSIILKESSDEKHLIERIKFKQINLDIVKKVFQHFCNYHQIPIGYNSEKYYELDYDLISNRINLPKKQIYYAFKMLIRENYLTERKNINHNSKIKFNCDTENINYFLEKNSDFEKIIDLLIRSYDDIWNNYISVNETIIAERLQLTKVSVVSKLNMLHQLKIITYLQNKESLNVQFLNPRPDINQLHFTSSTIQNQENEIKKAYYVTQFSRNIVDCRNKLLLNYFGEKSLDNCDNCDNCSKNINQYSSSFKVILNAMKIILRYEAKTAKEIYIEFSDVVPREKIKQTLRKLLENEVINVDKKNRISFNKLT